MVGMAMDAGGILSNSNKLTAGASNTNFRTCLGAFVCKKCSHQPSQAGSNQGPAGFLSEDVPELGHAG